MSILDHGIEQAPSGEAWQYPDGRTNLTPEEIDYSFFISQLGNSAINEHIGQLENILGHACMLGHEERQKLQREIAVYRQAQLVTEG